MKKFDSIMTKLFKQGSLLLSGCFLFAADQAQAASLINGGFEDTSLGADPAPSSVGFYDASAVPGWKTTATDNQIELWNSTFSGVSAYEGEQFAELNANQVSTLYQDVSGIAASLRIGFEFAHRGRTGTDSMRFELTDLGADGFLGGAGLDADTTLFSKLYSDGNTAWGFYNAAGESPIISLGNTVRFSYISVSSASTSPSVGNFLDAADFGVDVGLTPVPEGGAGVALLGLALAGLAYCRHKLA